MSAFQTLRWATYLKKHAVNSLSIDSSSSLIFVVNFCLYSSIKCKLMRKWAWFSWSGCHLEVTYEACCYFSCMLLLTFYCQTDVTMLINTFASACSSASRPSGPYVLCVSTPRSWFPPQHAPVSQEVPPPPAACQRVLRQQLRCGGRALWGGGEVPATPFGQAPPRSARGYVFLPIVTFSF